jgi:hypothetical protein
MTTICSLLFFAVWVRMLSYFSMSLTEVFAPAVSGVGSQLFKLAPLPKMPSVSQLQLIIVKAHLKAFAERGWQWDWLRHPQAAGLRQECCLQQVFGF